MLVSITNPSSSKTVTISLTVGGAREDISTSWRPRNRTTLLDEIEDDVTVDIADDVFTTGAKSSHILTIKPTADPKK